jgi:carboxyl-terminal processing protease
VVVLTLGGAFTVGYRFSAGNRATTAVAAPRVVDQVRSALQGAYYRPVPASVLRIGNVRQMLSALDDPYTAYLRPATYRLVRQETASTYTGIGASVLPAGHRFVVVSLLAGPAQAAGMHVGDTIVRIGGKSTANMSMTHAMARILGPPGTRVHLQLLREGHLLDVQVRRAVIHAPPVQARVVSYVGHRYGVVAVSSFSVGTSVLVRRELHRLGQQGAKGLVLDLREDPGGLVAQAVNVTSLFINHGIVVSLQGLHQPQEVLRANPGNATKLPLVVLVDRYTASAAEIVAAALRDNHRATIVGERTFGKALVQAVDPLTNGAALELSIAHYTTPTGQDLSGVGLEPEIRARDDPHTGQDEALTTALRVLTRPAS